MKREEKKETKLSLKERLKDKKERAKIELILYGIFFLGVIVFARVTGNNISYNEQNNNQTPETFISKIDDNYEYYMQITINDKTYEYYGKVLGNNSTINLRVEESVKSYYKRNQKYYIQNEENYILIDEQEVYPYIDYYYLNINNIKEYIDIAILEDNTYKTKISDLILNSSSEDYITINIEEGDKNIIIDYTSLLKLTKENISKAVVNITYSNIDNIISLEA